MEGAGGKPEAGYTFQLDCLKYVAMSPRSASHRPRQDWRALRTSHQHKGEYQTHTSHLVPSMGSIVSVVTLHGRLNQL